MRIISGKYKKREISGFDIVGTRPTMDRIKESLFAMIQDKIKNSICLDLFTGSGSLGLESLSNGAIKCYFVDNNQKIIDILKKNINNIKLQEDVEIIKSDYQDALKDFNRRNIKFDLIFLDPPYSLNLINKSIELISLYNLLSEKGYIICEFESEEIKQSNFNIYKYKEYGTKKIMILEKVQ